MYHKQNKRYDIKDKRYHKQTTRFVIKDKRYHQLNIRYRIKDITNKTKDTTNET